MISEREVAEKEDNIDRSLLLYEATKIHNIPPSRGSIEGSNILRNCTSPSSSSQVAPSTLQASLYLKFGGTPFDPLEYFSHPVFREVPY